MTMVKSNWSSESRDRVDTEWTLELWGTRSVGCARGHSVLRLVTVELYFDCAYRYSKTSLFYGPLVGHCIENIPQVLRCVEMNVVMFSWTVKSCDIEIQKRT